MHHNYNKWRPIRDGRIIDIDITNACFATCANCTRFCGNFTKEYIWYMSLEYYKKAIDSLKNYVKGGFNSNRIVAILGGEPTLHRDIIEMCKYGASVLGKTNIGLWTACSPKFYEMYDELKEIGLWLHVTPMEMCGHYQHTPMMVEIRELFDNEKVMWDYIDNCWIQHNWSGSITPKGAYFCEMAGNLSMLREDGIDGWDITKKVNGKEWWDFDPEQYQEQREWACVRCGAAAPLKAADRSSEIDSISPAYYDILKSMNSPKIQKGNYFIINKDNVHEHLDRDKFKDYGSWYKGFNFGSQGEGVKSGPSNVQTEDEEKWMQLLRDHVEDKHEAMKKS